MRKTCNTGTVVEWALWRRYLDPIAMKGETEGDAVAFEEKKL